MIRLGCQGGDLVTTPFFREEEARMNRLKLWIGASMMVAALMAGGCTSAGSAYSADSSAGAGVRGQFVSGSCKESERVTVSSKAAYAIYVDENGVPVASKSAEDLAGTDANKMCPTPPHDEGTGPCPANYCARLIAGRNYCLRC